MILDTSAIVAILHDEPDGPTMQDALVGSDATAVSAATLVELGMVMEGRRGPTEIWTRVEELLHDAEVEIVPFTAEHAALAREGWRRYGKGRHPAGLNLGDCFAYALAKSRNEPLLFKGDDFAQTDVKAAI